MSFLEMFDVLNERLVIEGKDPIAFDHDCREGICGMCSMYINGRPHGPWHATTTCQLHMRAFKDGDTIVVEPWRAKAFPVIKDLVTDRTAFDRIIQAVGLFLLILEMPLMAILFLLIKKKQMHHLLRLPALLAAPVWLPVKMHRHHVPFCKNCSPWLIASGSAGKKGQGIKHGSANGQRRFWKLHFHRCLRSCLSQRNFYYEYFPNA